MFHQQRNAPFEIDDVEKAIKKVKQAELASIYKKVDDRLMEKMDEWVSLKQKWNEPDWNISEGPTLSWTLSGSIKLTWPSIVHHWSKPWLHMSWSTRGIMPDEV